MIWFFYLAGCFWYWIGWFKPWYGLLSALAILASAGISFYIGLKIASKKLNFAIWFLLLGVVGFVLEVKGVASGAIFGSYFYTNELGYSLFGVPVVIAAAWPMVVFLGLNLSLGWKRVASFAWLFAAFCVVIFDIAMEPAAQVLGLWVWQARAVPLQNYLVWFLVAAVFCFLAQKNELLDSESRFDPELFSLGTDLYWAQLTYFLMITCISGL